MIAQQPLTNLQLELLKLYAVRLSDEQLLEVKDVLARYYAERLTHHVDRIWDQKNLSADDIEQWLAENDQ